MIRKEAEKKPTEPLTPRLKTGFLKVNRAINRALNKDHSLQSLLNWCLSEATIGPIHIYKYKMQIEAQQLITTQREIQRELGLRRVGLKERIEKLRTYGVCILYYKDLMLVDVSNYYSKGGNGCNHFQDLSGNGCNHFSEIGGNGCNHFLPKVGTAVTTRWERLLPLFPDAANDNTDLHPSKKEEEKDINKRRKGHEKEEVLDTAEAKEKSSSNFWTQPKPKTHPPPTRECVELAELWVQLYREKYQDELILNECCIAIEEMRRQTNDTYVWAVDIIKFIAKTKDEVLIRAFSKPPSIFKPWKIKDDNRMQNAFRDVLKKVKAQKDE